MDKEEFVEAIKTIETSGLQGLQKIFANPPGRKPASDLVEVSQFFNNLGEKDRISLLKAVRYGSNLATNSLLSILDGNVVIESTPEKGDLELYFCKNDARFRLNTPDGKTLSEIYRSID